MNWIRKHRPPPAMAVALAALVVALGGVAFATIPDSNGTIHACYQKSNGNLRVVESPNDCRSSEQQLALGGPASENSSTRTSGLVRLQSGSNTTVLQDGPFTWTAACRMTAAGETQVSLYVDSAEDGFTVGGNETELFSGPVRISQEETDQSVNRSRFWGAGRVDTVAAPSGASRDFVHSVGVRLFGSDCVAKVTVLDS